MKTYLILLSLLILSFSASFSQVKKVSSTTLACAWEAVGLRDAPGKKATYIQGIRFGEQVRYLGEESYLDTEQRTYIKVELSDGKVGWVHRYLFIEDGQAAVILDPARIYERPGTPSTVTLDEFAAGELVILGGQSNGWVFLATQAKTKQGWIQDQRKVSSADVDVELATLWKKLEKKEAKDKKELKALAAEARLKGSPIARLMEEKDEDLKAVPVMNREEENRPSRSESEANNKRKASIGTIEEQKVWDRATGRNFVEAVEKGPAIAIERAIKFPTPYYAFHKSLASGTTIRMDIPGNNGFVELVVVDRLEPEAPAIIALSPACLVSIFGTINPGDVVISYPKVDGK